MSDGFFDAVRAAHPVRCGTRLHDGRKVVETYNRIEAERNILGVPYVRLDDGTEMPASEVISE